MSTLHSPLRFAPIFKEKIWGGHNLAAILGKELPSGAAIGESWEISGFPGDLSRCTTPAHAGADLQELLDQYKHDLTGAGISADFFPLLYKFIDANDNLSVQVHPDDSQAREHGWGAFGKTECWYIAHAKPGARIIVGLKDGVSCSDIAAAIEATALDELLNYIDITTGDVLFIPAGTVHAILDGTVIYEVQESSDTTFRLYDWGRTDARGNSRPLHIEESLLVMNTDYHEHHKIPPVVCGDFDGGLHALRAACSYFALEEYHFERSHSHRLPSKRSFQVISLLAGDLTVDFDGRRAELSRGESILLPATRASIGVEGNPGARFLLSSAPDVDSEIIDVCRRQSIPDDCLSLLGGNPAHSDIAFRLSRNPLRRP
jgi:mannose-6-phosphate isomerase